MENTEIPYVSHTRLRISSHRLSIEVGRYARIIRAVRLCSKCSLGVLGDEMHFLLECPAFNATSESLIKLANENCKQIMVMNSGS